jgi:hypothetical protein
MVFPPHERGAAASEVAGRGLVAMHIGKTPPSTLPREGIARAAALSCVSDRRGYRPLRGPQRRPWLSLRSMSR